VFFKQDKLPKPLTDYTVDELLAAQKVWAKNWRGSAAGRYQIIRKTLQGLVSQLGIPGTAHFNADLQDRLGFQLLQNRGWQAFASGQVSAGAYALQLAKEWASIPVLSDVQGQNRPVSRGESYYAGDGVNKSQAKADEFEAVLASIKPGAKPDQAPAIPASNTEPARTSPPAQTSASRGLVGWIILAAVACAGVVSAGWQWITHLFQ